MALRVHLESDGPGAEPLHFDDGQELILFGRDATRCHVVFPAGETRVSREHCALRRVLGRYRLVLNGQNPVYVDGRRGVEDEGLKPISTLELGKGGPRVVVETLLAARGAPPTVGGTRFEGPGTSRRRLHRSLRTAWLLAATAVVLVAAALVYQAASRARPFPLAAVERSIYLVMIRNEAGQSWPYATAWVVGPGVLATNAHVVEGLGEDQTLFVRSSSARPRDFEVESVTVHPGYHHFQQLLLDYQPVDRSTGLRRDFHPVCDVALLTVKERVDLGPPLALAGRRTLRELAKGEPVALVGYPVEGVLVSAARPTPTSQLGEISALTDVFHGDTDDPGQRYRVYHNLSATGGASGSPLVNREGRVVAIFTATASIWITDQAGQRRRISNGAGINYAQRADLVRELLDGSARLVQASRRRAWRRELERLYACGRPTRAQILAEVRRALNGALRPLNVDLETLEAVAEQRGEIRQAGRDAGATFRVPAPSPGHYLVVALADHVKDVHVELLDTAAVADAKRAGHHAVVTERLAGGRPLQIRVSSEQARCPETGFTVLVFHAGG